MKKSSIIQLVLITAALASCNHQQEKPEKKVYLRTDSTAKYSPADKNIHHGGYYAFRPYGIFSGGYYHRTGYYSGAIHESSNIGSNAFKSSVVRGGFGSSVFHVSS